MAVAIVLVTAAPAQAATWWWNSLTTGLWTNGTNWSNAASGGTTGTAPTNDTTTDVVVFNTTGTNGAVVAQLGQDQSIGGITVANTGATTIRSDTTTPRTFTIGAGGITINAGAGAFTIGATGSAVNVAIAGSQSWTNNSSNVFTALGGVTSSAAGLQTLSIAGSGNTTLSGIVGDGSGTVALTKSGNGTLTMTAANTYSGTTSILGGSLQLGGASGSLANTAAVNVASGTFVAGDSTAATNNGVTNRINSAATLSLGGGGAAATFQLNAAAAGGTHSQTLASLAASRGFNTLTTNAATGTNTLTFTGASGTGYARSTGAFVNIATQTGFGVNFTNQPTGSGAVAGTGTDLVLVGAAINGNDFVGLAGSGPFATGTATYTNTSTTTWTAGKNMNVTGNLSPAATAVNSIRFADATARTVTLSGTTVITSGMVMSASTNVVNSGLTGGTLTSGNGTDLVVVDRRALGNGVRDVSPFNVQSVITDNGSTPIALTVVGSNAAGGLGNGFGQVQLGNSNNFTGGTTIAGGAVLIGNDLAFGAVPGVAQTNIRIINNGFIKASAAVTINANRGIDLGANGFLGLDGQSNNTLTVNGPITGTGGIYSAINRGGTIILNGTNSFSGTLDIHNGAVRAVDGIGLPSSVNLRMGSLVVGGYLETSGTFTRALGSAAGQVQWLNSIYGPTTYVSGGFSAVNGPLVVALGGTASPQTFQWNSASVHNTTVLSLQNSSATSTLTWLGPIDLNGGARQINNDGGFAATISGVISGNASSSLTKTGTGTLVLTASNTYGGTTTVSAGTLQIGSGGTTGALAASGTIAGSAGATLAFNRANTAASGVDFAAVIGGAINVAQLGTGTLVLNGANTYTGTTSVNAGTLQIGNNGTTGSLSTSSVITGSAGATLAFNRTNTVASGTDFASTIGGALNVAQLGSGTLVFSGANTYTGTTTLSAGGLLLSNTNAVQNSTVAVGGGSILFDASVTGNSFVLGALSGTGGINLQNNAGTPASIALAAGGNNASTTYQGAITSGGTGSSTFTKQGSGTLTLDPGVGQSSSVGAFSVTNGAVRLTSGTLSVTAANSLRVGSSTGPTFTLDGGQLLTSSGSPYIGGDFGGRGTFTLTSGTWTNTSGFISIKYGAGGDGSVLNVNGGLVDSSQIQLGQNGGTSTLNLNGGVIAVDYLFNTNLPTSVLNLNGGILRAKSTQANFINLTSGSTSTVNVLAGGAIIDTSSFNSTILMPLLSGTSNDGGLTKQGAGTLTLSATNTFAGATSINAGTLAFDRIAALATTSGITIGSGAGLTYSGAAGTLDRNVAVSSGTGTVRNTGSGMLTLSGTLTKNGSVLRFNTGTFTVSGLITGANANSDLVVDTATVTLTNSNNDYNGPTFVQNGGTLILGANNVISSTSAVTVDASTLTVGGFTDTIQSLTTAGNSTINVTASGGSSGGLTMGSLTLGAGTDTLGLTMTSPTAGRYTLLTYTGSRSGTFDSVTGLNPNYNLVYGGASTSSIDLQMKASIGTVSATTANTKIIVGGSTAISYTVANTSPTDAATLSFQSGSNSLTVIGSSSGSALANQTSSPVSGLTFTSGTVGLGQIGSFTVTDPDAITTTGNGSVTVDVLNHSRASFAGIDAASRTLDFGSFDASTSTWSGGDGGSGTIGFSLFNIASGGFTNAQTAGLDLYDWSFTGDAIFAPGLSQFQDLASGSSNAFSASIVSPGSLTERSYSAIYTLRFRDQSLPGATNTRDLTLTMNVIVVPEPATWLAGLIGSALTALHLRRRRRSLPADDRP